MADNSKIEWCDATWNPIRSSAKEDMTIRGRKVPKGKWGYHCERISPGCVNCYAATMNGRMLPAWGTGLDFTVPNREKVEIFLDETELLKPLKWKKPRRIFVESMSDWCATFVTDEMRDRILAVAALCPQHTFLFLSKRSDRCAEYFSRPKSWSEHGLQRTLPGYLCRKLDSLVYGTHLQNRNWVDGQWPLPNVHLGFSAENQEYFDARWAHMHQLAAAGWKVWCSAEPLLGPIDMSYPQSMYPKGPPVCCSGLPNECGCMGLPTEPPVASELCQVVVGGESGHGTRPCNVEWVRSIVRQSHDAGVACFVKQMGANPEEEVTAPRDGYKWMRRVVLKDRKGGDPLEWPEDLRVRQFPEASHGTAR